MLVMRLITANSIPQYLRQAEQRHWNRSAPEYAVVTHIRDGDFISLKIQSPKAVYSLSWVVSIK